MRLLNVHSLEFQQFHPADIPKYVIASHRWAGDAEASIKDICKRRNTDKSGYKKVEGYARYVRENVASIDWMWIDTCCINQESSQEVSKAVNSMFKWYRNAEVCVAYLADVTAAGHVHGFRQSNWFSRGWTLQELLAPRVGIFLTQQWQLIGYKGGNGYSKSGIELQVGPSLVTTIAATTGIPESVLRDYGHSTVLSNEGKLEWMTGRETTIEEDMSYCLLGIFDVTMVANYGEGEVKARERLFEEISKKSKLPLARPDGAETLPLPTSNLPFLRDPDFVDRGELDRLTQKLLSARARIALVGLGGVGKSQLAIESCYRLRERSLDTWVLWVHTSTAARFEESIRKLADDVRIPGRGDVKANIFQLVYEWLRDERRGRWLLVLDNVDDASFLFEPPDTHGDERGGRMDSMQRVRMDYLPICAHGSTIVTTRSREMASRLVDSSDTIVVQPMDGEHALALLEKKIGRQNDTTTAMKLTAALENMPLAIAQAAAYINSRAPRCSIEQYLAKFEKSDKTKTSLLNANSGELRRDREAKNSIILTWQISFEHIYQSRRSAANFLSLMSFFDHQGIPEFLLRVKDVARPPHKHKDSLNLSDEDDEAFEDDIVALRDYLFISVAQGESTFEMHRLVQLAARKWLESQGQYEHWAEQSIRNLDIALPNGEYKNWHDCLVLYPHAKLALELRLNGWDASLRCASVLYKAAWFASAQGSATEAEVLATNSRSRRRKLLGDENGETLSSEAMLASVLQRQGKYEAAEEMNRRALEGREKVLGKEHPDTLTSVSDLASVLRYQGQYEAAEEMNRRALEGREKVLGKEHPFTLTSVSNLASVLQDQEQYEAAEEMNRRALEGREKVLGKEHPDTLTSVSNLAYLLHQ